MSIGSGTLIANMEDNNWLVPAIFGLIILIGVLTFAFHMIAEHAKARRNRIYKSLDEHSAVNGADVRRGR